MKNKVRKKETPATIRELAAAMKALGAYGGENTEAEHEKEAKRLGGKEYYRMRVVNALLGIVETEAMMSEVASPSTELMLHAHQQALESAGAMDSKEKLLGFLRWRTLRIEGPLKQIAKDKETGPIPLAASWAAEGLQQLLGFCVNSQHRNPETLDPSVIKSDLKKARESLTNAVANVDIMLDLLAQAEEFVTQPKTHSTKPEASPQKHNNRVQRASKLLLLDMYVPLCVERRTTDFFIPSADWAQIQKRGQEWGIWRMSEREFSQFEEKKMQEFTKTLSTVSTAFPLKVYALIDNLMEVTAKTIDPAANTSDLPKMPRISELLASVGQTREKLFALTRQIEPDMASRITTKPTRNPLEALLLMVDTLLENVQATKFPVPDDVRLELARFLAFEFDFSPAWPYTRKKMQSAMTLGHPDWRPNIPDRTVLSVAAEIEKFLIDKLKAENGKFADPTQAGMAVVYLTHDMLCGKSQVLGGDSHGMHYIASVLVNSYQFSPAFPYSTEQIRAALRTRFRFEP